MIYIDNPYCKTFSSKVKAIVDGYVILEESYFYPVGGGQPHDEGVIRRGDQEFRVSHVRKINGESAHKVDRQGLEVGEVVECQIDWERRSKLMRSHTAAHVVSAVIHKKTGALITGNQLSIEKIRIDYSLEEFDPLAFVKYLEEANEEIKKNHQVMSKIISREQANTLPALSKLAAGLPESVREVRIVTIGDIDEQACAGTHVESTKEIGQLQFVKCENKGKQNRRMTFTIN